MTAKPFATVRVMGRWTGEKLRVLSAVWLSENGTSSDVDVTGDAREYAVMMATERAREDSGEVGSMSGRLYWCDVWVLERLR